MARLGLQRVFELERRFSRTFLSLESHDLITCVFRLIESELAFERAIFVEASALERHRRGADILTPEAWGREERPAISFASSRVMDIEVLRQDLQLLSKCQAESNGQSWRWIDATRGSASPSSSCLITVNNVQSQTAIGYFFCVGGPRRFDRIAAAHDLLDAISCRLDHVFTLSQAYLSTKALNYVDDLTGLYNSRYLNRVLDTEVHRVDRDGGLFSVLFIDVDHLKRVNDQRGHVVGSKVLKEVGKILAGCIRTTDYAFRYGGDEFILVLPGAGAEESAVVAERIRSEVERQAFLFDQEQVKVTLSIGIAVFPTHASSRDELIKMADEAMYVGKRRSRNTVFVAS